jgi:hypothetical protein
MHSHSESGNEKNIIHYDACNETIGEKMAFHAPYQRTDHNAVSVLCNEAAVGASQILPGFDHTAQLHSYPFGVEIKDYNKKNYF